MAENTPPGPVLAPEEMNDYVANFADNRVRKTYGIPKGYPMDSEMYPYSLTQLADFYKSVPNAFPNKDSIPKDEIDVMGMYLRSLGIPTNTDKARMTYKDPKLYAEAMYPHDAGVSPHLYPVTRTDPVKVGETTYRPRWDGSVSVTNRHTGEQMMLNDPQGRDGVKQAYLYQNAKEPLSTYLHEGLHYFPRNLTPNKEIAGKEKWIAQNIADNLKEGNRWVPAYFKHFNIKTWDDFDKMPQQEKQQFVDEMRALYWQEYAKHGKPKAKTISDVAPLVGNLYKYGLHEDTINYLYEGRKKK